MKKSFYLSLTACVLSVTVIGLASFKNPVKKEAAMTQAYYFAKADLTNDPYGFDVSVSGILNVDCSDRSYDFVMIDIRNAFADYLPKHGRGNTNRLKVTVFGPYSTEELADSKWKDEVSELKGRFNLKVVGDGDFQFSCP